MQGPTSREFVNFVRPSVEKNLNTSPPLVPDDAGVVSSESVDTEQVASGENVRTFYETIISESSSAIGSRYKKSEDKLTRKQYDDCSNQCLKTQKEQCSYMRRTTANVENGRKNGKNSDEGRSWNVLKRQETGCQTSGDENKSVSQGYCLLRYSQNGDLDDVKRLVELGVNINFQDTFGWTALMSASYGGHLAVVEYLLQQEADYAVCDKTGTDAKTLAMKKHDFAVLQLLIDNGKGKKRLRRKSAAESISTATTLTEERAVYCEVCRVEFKDTKKQHLASTLHLFNLKLDTPKTSYFIPESNRGFQMMVRKGWDVDKGLGSDGQGRKFPVQTVLKQDRQGLGTNEKGKSKPKVTHFAAGDPSAVKRTKTERTMRSSTLSKKQKKKKHEKDKQWERDLRIYMNTE